MVLIVGEIPTGNSKDLIYNDFNELHENYLSILFLTYDKGQLFDENELKERIRINLETKVEESTGGNKLSKSMSEKIKNAQIASRYVKRAKNAVKYFEKNPVNEKVLKETMGRVYFTQEN